MVSIRRNIPIKVHFLVKASSMLNLYGYRTDFKGLRYGDAWQTSDLNQEML